MSSSSRLTPPTLRPLCVAALLSFVMCAPAMAQSAATTDSTDGTTAAQGSTTPNNAVALPAANVQGQREATPNDLPDAYAGGQVARGINLGTLGNQKSIDVPYSVSSYTSQLIEDQQARSVGDVLANDASVRVDAGYGNFAQVYYIRGFVLDNDDISLNGLFGIAPRQMVSTDAIERVELFKGANAFLNGASPNGTAIGGGVNLQLKRADDTPLTRVTVEGSGSGELGTHIDVGRRFGPDGGFGIRFNEAVRDGTTSVQDEHNNSKTTSLALDWRGDKVRISADFLYQKNHIGEGKTSYYFDTGSALPAPPAATSNYAQSWTYSTTEDTLGILRAEYDFAPNWTAYVTGGVRHGNENGEYSSPTYNGATGAVTATELGVNRNEDAVSGEAGVRGKFNTGPVSHFVTAAVSGTSLKVNQAYTYSYPGFSTSLANVQQVAFPSVYTLGNMSDPLRTETLFTRSVAASDTLGFVNDRVLLTLGLRHQSLGENTYSSTTGAFTQGYSESITTPVYGLVLKPLQDVAVYFNHSEGLSAGDTVTDTSAKNYGSTLAPYRSKQTEFGVKYDTARFGASLAFFQIGKPSAYTNAAGYYAADGDQRHRGVEASVYGSPVTGLRLISGVTYIQSKLLNQSDATTDGNRAAGVPAWQVNVGADYDLPWVHGLSVNARWIFTGSEYTSASNNQTIPSWNRFDVGAAYKTQIYGKNTVFRLNVLNVANKAYWSNVTYSSSTTSYLTEGAPRTFLFSMSTDF